MIDMLMQGLPLVVAYLFLVGLVRFAIHRFRFDSEDVLQVRDSSGSTRELRLSALREAPRREAELRKITAKPAT